MLEGPIRCSQNLLFSRLDNPNSPSLLSSLWGINLQNCWVLVRMTGFSLSMDIALKMIGEYLATLLCREEIRNEGVFYEFLNFISEVLVLFLSWTSYPHSWLWDYCSLIISELILVYITWFGINIHSEAQLGIQTFRPAAAGDEAIQYVFDDPGQPSCWERGALHCKELCVPAFPKL